MSQTMFTIAAFCSAVFRSGNKCERGWQKKTHPERVGWSCHHHCHHINHSCRHSRFASMSLLCQHRLLCGSTIQCDILLVFDYIPKCMRSTHSLPNNTNQNLSHTLLFLFSLRFSLSFALVCSIRFMMRKYRH